MQDVMDEEEITWMGIITLYNINLGKINSLIVVLPNAPGQWIHVRTHQSWEENHESAEEAPRNER